MSSKSGRAEGRPDIEGDTRRLWDVLSDGGIAICPTDLGYALLGGSREAVERICEAKQRGAHKREGLLMGRVTSQEVFELDQYQWDIIDCVTEDFDLPLGIIARYRPDHPLIKRVAEDPGLLDLCTHEGRIATAVHEGVFLEALGLLSHENLHPVAGSSANITGTGAKYRVEDIEPEILAIADIVVDYGLCRYHTYKLSGTQINFDTMELLRVGACYELIADVLKRRFGMDLPPDPGREVSRYGHVNEFGTGKGVPVATR